MRKVKVRLYSVLREEAGSNEIELEVPDDCRAADLLSLLEARLPRSLRALGIGVHLIANGRTLRPHDQIPDDAAVVHVLPPSSGGSERVIVRVLSEEPVDLADVVKLLRGDDSVGALALFIGVVRGLNRGERVKELRYEHSEELLEAKLREIGEEAIKEFKLSKVFIAHYVGTRRPGELTMVVGVSAEGRAEAFPALQWIVDKVKHEAPVWKEEVRESGRYFLVGDKEVKADELPPT